VKRLCCKYLRKRRSGRDCGFDGSEELNVPRTFLTKTPPRSGGDYCTLRLLSVGGLLWGDHVLDLGDQ
jgi:hypothetical protein